MSCRTGKGFGCALLWQWALSSIQSPGALVMSDEAVFGWMIVGFVAILMAITILG